MPEIKYTLNWTAGAREQLDALAAIDAKKHARVLKCLSRLQCDPKYPALNSHKYAHLKGHSSEGLWESYVENRTPAAWRVFWSYGPEKDEITIVAITAHP